MMQVGATIHGVSFRSRLEARWAAWFGLLGYRWEYEPKKFILDANTQYIPDFALITELGETFYLEVKAEGRPSPKGARFGAVVVQGDPSWVLGVAGNQQAALVICPRCERPTPQAARWEDVAGMVAVDCRFCANRHPTDRRLAYHANRWGQTWRRSNGTVWMDGQEHADFVRRCRRAADEVRNIRGDA